MTTSVKQILLVAEELWLEQGRKPGDVALEQQSQCREVVVFDFSKGDCCSFSISSRESPFFFFFFKPWLFLISNNFDEDSITLTMS